MEVIINKPDQLKVSELVVYAVGMDWQPLAQRIRELESVTHVELRAIVGNGIQLLVFVDKAFADRTRFAILMNFDEANPVEGAYVIRVDNLGPVM
jgi:hypothetical protein